MRVLAIMWLVEINIVNIVMYSVGMYCKASIFCNKLL